MRANDLSRVDDGTLLSRLHQLVARERAGMSTLLVHLAEVEERKLHVPAGYSSMFDYCLREFRWTEQTAAKRLRAARCARRFPVIFEAIADGRLNVSGVMMLSGHLHSESASQLLVEAFGKTRAEIELLIAARAPKADVPTKIRAAEPAEASPLLATRRNADSTGSSTMPEVSPGTPATVTSTPVRPTPPAKLTALSPERFAVQVTIDRETHALLRRAQELLSHQHQSGEVAKVLHRALAQLVERLEKQKYATTQRPRQARAQKSVSRSVPAAVRRAVRERDGDRCTFVSEGGHRCESRTRLEFDHVVPFARGGAATVEGIRLRCRTHNQYEAERAFGAEFMAKKRVESRAGAGTSRSADRSTTGDRRAIRGPTASSSAPTGVAAP